MNYAKEYDEMQRGKNQHEECFFPDFRGVKDVRKAPEVVVECD